MIENEGITTECFVDAYPKANITWFSPLGQGLATFIEEKNVNETVYSSILHCKFIDILVFLSKYLLLFKYHRIIPLNSEDIAVLRRTT